MNQEQLISDRDASAVQSLKCLLNVGHDWEDFGTNQQRCEYCGKVVQR